MPGIGTLTSASAAERLTTLVDSEDRFDIAAGDLLPLQIAAAGEIFQDRIGRIKLLQSRAQ